MGPRRIRSWHGRGSDRAGRREPCPAASRRIDESDDYGSRPWLTSLATALPQDAVIISWWNYSTALWYAQYVEGWRPDVTIIDDRTILDQNLGDAEQAAADYVGKRPVFLIRLPNDLQTFGEQYDLRQLPGVDGQQVLQIIGPKGSAAIIGQPTP